METSARQNDRMSKLHRIFMKAKHDYGVGYWSHVHRVQW